MDIVPEEYTGWAQVIAGTIIASVLGLLGYLYKNWRDRRRKLKAAYKTILKKSTDLQPEEVMGEIRGSHKGGFREYCLQRDEIEEIRKRIAEGNDVLVIGNPLAGKSRAIYEALKHTDNPCEVTIPRVVDVDPNELNVRQYISGTCKGVLLLDDINKYVAKQNFEFLLQQYIDKGYVIVATCRKGPELAGAKSRLEQIFASLFNDPVELGQVDKEAAEAVAHETKVDMPTSYDGNIGSIFVPIEAMRLRYANECDDKGRAVLRSIKRLFMGGVYREGGIYSEVQIKKVCAEIEELKLEKFKWKPVLDSLTKLAFLRSGKEGIVVEETYVEQIFTFDSSMLDNFRELAGLFSDDPEALYKVGNRAIDTEFSEDFGDDYVHVKRLAVAAFQAVLPHLPKKSYPEQNAVTQNGLGIAYRILGGIEDKAGNCSSAIAAYQEALKVRTLVRFPMDYAMTQNNLGNALSTLGEVEDKSSNCRKAITAYQEALKVRTLERFPIEYAATQNNLGNAFSTLGEVENRSTNCKKAIAAFLLALKVRTLGRFPIQYAMTQNNLGAAYDTLAEVEDRPANRKRAREAYEAALSEYRKLNMPLYIQGVERNFARLDAFEAEE